MNLNSTQRRTLQYYRQLHGTQPGTWSLIASYGWRYLLALVIGLAAPAILLGNTPITFLAAGLTLGVVARDLSRFRVLAMTWSVFGEVFDWARIDRLCLLTGIPFTHFS